MRIIGITNQKGGSGKTTTAVNLAAALAEKKRKILLIDLDAQASASSWLNVPGEENGLLEVLEKGRKGSISGLIRKTSIQGVSIIPASLWLNHAERRLSGEPGADVLLQRQLGGVKGWDYILLDCPPALNILTRNALVAAKEILVPVEASFMALAGLAQLLETVEVVKDRLNPELVICGIIACRVDRRTAHAKEVVEILKGRFGSIFINTPIRENVRLKECPSFHQSILDYDPKSAGAEDYRAVARVIIAQE